eukprot:3745982-Rhodomonas_salina.3
MVLPGGYGRYHQAGARVPISLRNRAIFLRRRGAMSGTEIAYGVRRIRPYDPNVSQVAARNQSHCPVCSVQFAGRLRCIGFDSACAMRGTAVA